MRFARPTNGTQRDRVAERVSAASYGTVLIMTTLLLVEAEDVATGLGWELMVGVGAATWLAHLYAEVLGNRVRSTEALQPHALRSAMADGLPILIASVLPAMILFLGRLEVVAPRQALWIAVIAALLQLVAVGALVGIVSQGPTNSWRYAAVASVIGVAVVVLLVAMGH